MRVISGNIFQPIDYSSYLTDMQAASKAHLELEDAYALIDTQASTLDKLKDSIIDLDVYNTYTAFNEDLQAASDILATQGLTGTSRRDLNKMRAQYAKLITPIEEAIKKREEEAKQLQDAYLKSNGKLRYNRRASDTRLSDYIKGAVSPYTSFNLDDLSKEAAAAFKAYSDRNVNTEEGRRFNNAYLDFITTTGYNQDEASAMLTMARNNPLKFAEQFPDAANMINDIMSKYNIGSDSPYSEDIRKEAFSSIIEGANLGLGYDEKHDLRENKLFTSGLGSSRRGGSGYSDYGDQVAVNTTAIGVSGEDLPAHVKRAEGLIPTNTGKGFSTNNLSKARADLEKAKAKISQYTLEQLKEFEDYKRSQDFKLSQVNKRTGTTGLLGLASGLQISHVPKDFNNYKRDLEELNKAQETLRIEESFMDDLVTRYSHLKSNDESMYNAIQRGLAIDTATSRHLDLDIQLVTSEANDTNLQFTFKQGLIPITKERYEGKGTGTINVYKKGDTKKSKIDYDDFKKLLNNEDARIRLVTDNGQIKYGIIDPESHETYIIENSGASVIDTAAMNRYYKDVNDFSANTVKQNMVNPSEFNNILSTGLIPRSLKANKDGTYSVTITDPNSAFNFMRAVITPNGELITSLTLEEALTDNSRATNDLIRYGVNKTYRTAVSSNTSIGKSSPMQ